MAMFEEDLPGDVRASIPGAAREGAALLGVSPEEDPSLIVMRINQFVASPPKRSLFRRVDNWNDRAMPLGAIWGAQLVRCFGWQWALVVEQGDEKERSIGIFDARRTMGVYPFDYVFGCLEYGEVPTILLAYNMIQDRALPAFPDRSYTNIMDGIRHIVPPR